MLHNYVPSGTGRDNFIFNDRLYKHGKTGSFLKQVQGHKHVNEFWAKSNKKCEKIVREEPTQFLQFGVKRKVYKPIEVNPSNAPKVSDDKYVPVVGYQGTKFVHGKTDWKSQKKSDERGGNINLPSFRKHDVERIERRMGLLKQKIELDDGFAEVKKSLPVQQKKPVRNVVKPKYVSGYQGYRPRNIQI